MLALELPEDSEVEINDVQGEDDDITLYALEFSYKESRQLLWRQDTSLFSWRVQEALRNDYLGKSRTVHSWSHAYITPCWHVLSHCLLKLIVANPLQ